MGDREEARQQTSQMEKFFSIQSQRMNRLEQRLEAEAVRSRNVSQVMHNSIQEETKNRTKHNEKMDMRMDGVEKRLQDLEFQKNDAANQRQSEPRQTYSTSSGGGWPEKTSRVEIEEAAKQMMNQVPNDIKSKLRAPTPQDVRQHRESEGTTRDSRRPLSRCRRGWRNIGRARTVLVRR